MLADVAKGVAECLGRVYFGHEEAMARGVGVFDLLQTMVDTLFQLILRRESRGWHVDGRVDHGRVGGVDGVDRRCACGGEDGQKAGEPECGCSDHDDKLWMTRCV